MPKGRRRTRGEINPFESNASLSLGDVDKDIYGEIAEVDSRRRTAKPVNIFSIYPDFSQPRRVLPSEVRPYWNGDPQQIGDLFMAWLHIINDDRPEPFDLEMVLQQIHLPPGIEGNEDEIDRDLVYLRKLPPVERALMELVQLAVSIRDVGLTNPITVVRQQDVYRLETGERRWLAYHLLNLYFADENWTMIPAEAVQGFDVWRQATENSAREDLNAIGKARQFAILLMDLLSEQDYQFSAYSEVIEAGLPERAYYAQVADGNEFRIPAGEGERLLHAMGLKNPVQLRQYRALLRLPDALWQHADDHNLTEGEIRKLSDSTVTRVTVQRDEVQPNPLVESVNKKRRDKIWAYAQQLDVLNSTEKNKAIEAIEADLKWLDNLRRALERR
ncbi:MAG: ParB N-terminal domain-containing protein [Anaerolineae bacterium]|nr:ParB N-terminal domain-containing protein [Anaerolineae bacterium]